MSVDLLQLIQPLQPFAQSLVQLAGRAGVQPRITSTVRSHGQQQRLYDAYLRGESHYPVAPPGKSAHEFGFAFDMVCATQEDLRDCGTVWRSWGGVWSPADEVHFEYPGFVPPATDLSAIHHPAWYMDPLASPENACQLVDFFAGKWWASLLELGLGENEILEILSQPCTSVLETVKRLGL